MLVVHNFDLTEKTYVIKPSTFVGHAIKEPIINKNSHGFHFRKTGHCLICKKIAYQKQVNLVQHFFDKILATQFQAKLSFNSLGRNICCFSKPEAALKKE